MNLYRALNARPRPDIRINDFGPSGGNPRSVNFRLRIQNYGNQPVVCVIAARVGETPVECEPSRVNLVGNGPEASISIRVPRPQVGDLVKEFNRETTLYGNEFIVQVQWGKRRIQHSWSEVIYDAETNRPLYEIQQRVWRRGRDELTVADRRAELVQRHIEAIEEPPPPRHRGPYA